MINKNIRYLINGNPPNKKDKRTTDGEGWGFWVEVSDKGNYAIFNPYCYVHNDPLSLYVNFSLLRPLRLFLNLNRHQNSGNLKLYLKIKMQQ